MAKWIDKAALWTLATLFLYLLLLILSDGSLVVSALITFLAMLALRAGLNRLPDQRRLKRSEKAAYAKQILCSWALMNREEALASIRNFLPEWADQLTDQIERDALCFMARLPDGEALDANEVLQIWRSASNRELLHLVVTGPVQAEARVFAESLQAPSVRITDGAALTRMLMKTITEIPEDQRKTGRRLPFKRCVIRYILSLRPLRTAAYSLSFAMLYAFSRSWVYLIAAALMLTLSLVHYALNKTHEPQ